MGGRPAPALPVEIAGLEIRAGISAAFAGILTPDACRFVARLAERFKQERQRLLAARSQRQRQINGGPFPDFLNDARGGTQLHQVRRTHSARAGGPVRGYHGTARAQDAHQLGETRGTRVRNARSF